MPYAIADVELTQPLPALTLGAAETGLGLLVRRGGRPIDFLLAELGPGASLTPAALARLIADGSRFRLVQEAIAEQLLPARDPAPPADVTVAVCVQGSTAELPACLESLMRLQLREILVVDAGGQGESASALVSRFEGARYLREERPGLSALRNRALREATGEWVGLLAADAIADPGWVAGLAAALVEQPDAAAVSGLVLPRALETEAQVRFERAGGFGLGFEPLRLAGEPSRPADVRQLDALGNLAVRRDAALSLGGFDESPSARLPPSAAREHDLRYRLMRAGHALAYEPRMLVFARSRPRARRSPSLRGAPRIDDQARVRAFEPLEVVDVDLERGLPGPGLAGSDAFAVFWWGDVPLGHAELTRREQECEATLAHRVARSVAPAVGQRLFGDGFEAAAPSRSPAPAPPAPPLEDLLALSAPLRTIDPAAGAGSEEAAATSVIVCTRRRPRDLERCLHSLRRLAVTPGEILVVDNDPRDPATRQVVGGFEEATYVPEERPGLSVARNTGLRAARGRVIAFVDDDTAVHERWLERLLRGFAEPGVLAVTGLVLPARLGARAQVVFEKAMGGAGRGYRPIVFDAEFFEPQVPYGVPVWAIGAGANMAIRREAFDLVGQFDERLGAGAAGCSEDSELWYRILAAGGECRYQPDAVVLHWHRDDMRALRRQAHDYLRGHVAGLFVQCANHRHPGNLRRVVLTIPRYLVGRVPGELGLAGGSRSGTFAAELTGYLAGLRYWRLALPARRAT